MSIDITRLVFISLRSGSQFCIFLRVRERRQKMLKVEDQIKKIAALTGVMLMAAAEALAQDKCSRPARRIVVSIPDRKLAVMEGDRVVRIFETAVGAPKSPSPTGPSRSSTASPTPPGTPKAKSFPPARAIRWHPLDGTEPQRLRNSRHQPSRSPSAATRRTAASGCGITKSKSSSRWSPSATRWNCTASARPNSRALRHHTSSRRLLPVLRRADSKETAPWKTSSHAC